jgi:colanic acid/amylovoran biosynthesis glycosyltransferase
MLDAAYILLRFPHLTETFVADEISEMQQQGAQVRIVSLLAPADDPIHPASRNLARDAQYAPRATSWLFWWSQLYFFARSPSTYLGLLIQLIRQPYTRSFWFLFSRRVLIFLKAISVAYVLRNTPVQIIHSHFAWLSGAAAMIVARLLEKPFTVTVHAYDLYASNDLVCLVARAAAHIVAISEYNKQMLLETCSGLKEDEISVVHCGIDLSRFTPRRRPESQPPISILSVGSLIEKKGHDHLIEACQQLDAQGIDIQCTIIGRGPNEADLKRLARARGIEDRVTFAGALQREDVLNAYRCTDLFALACVVAPSGDRDGIPVVLMEAMATQVPVISTHVSGIPELVRNEETGLVVPPQDATALARAVARLSVDKALQERLAQNGRSLVEEDFEIRGTTTRLRQVLLQVVANRS